MKAKSFFSVAGLVLAMAFTISSCGLSSSYRRNLPPDLIKRYEETVDVPDVSAEDLFKKIRLYFIWTLDEDYFEDSFQRTVGTAECTKTTTFESKIKGAFNEGSNRIVFKPRKELAGLFKEKPRVTEISVLANSGQYRITGIFNTVYATRDAQRDEIEKVLRESLPEVEEHWKSFIAGMKQFITERITTEQITDEEFEKLMQNGYLEIQKQMSKPPVERRFGEAKAIFLKAATARPDNAHALHNYGLCFSYEGAEIVNYAAIARIKPPKNALNYFNRALYIFGFVPQGDSEIKKAVSETLRLRRQAEQEVYGAGSMYCN